jgi:hypothetical protein
MAVPELSAGGESKTNFDAGLNERRSAAGNIIAEQLLLASKVGIDYSERDTDIIDAIEYKLTFRRLLHANERLHSVYPGLLAEMLALAPNNVIPLRPSNSNDSAA